MSGGSYSAPCPNCGKEANVYSDWKPFDYTEYQCPHCGFYSTVETGYMDLDDLNEFRMDSYGLEPLTELPKQEYEL